MEHIPLMFLPEWREFPSKPCLEEKKMMTARVSMFLKSRASPDMLPFGLCKKKRLAFRHMNRLLFPTTLSIPSYDIGKYVGLRTYQRPLVKVFYVFVNKIETQLSPCRWSILNNLTVTQLFKKLRAFSGTRLFITNFTRAHQLSLSWSIPV